MGAGMQNFGNFNNRGNMMGGGGMRGGGMRGRGGGGMMGMPAMGPMGMGMNPMGSGMNPMMGNMGGNMGMQGKSALSMVYLPISYCVADMCAIKVAFKIPISTPVSITKTKVATARGILMALSELVKSELESEQLRWFPLVATTLTLFPSFLLILLFSDQAPIYFGAHCSFGVIGVSTGVLDHLKFFSSISEVPTFGFYPAEA